MVLDPVMVAESGAELLAAQRAGGADRAAAAPGDGRHAERARGPGAGGPPEAEAGAAGRPESAAAEALARSVHALGPRPSSSPAVTGEQAIDLFFDGERLVEIPGERHPDGAAHGSGCTHSSVLAARLAWGDEPLQAARRSRRSSAARAVANGLTEIGAGAGPVDVLGLRRGARLG